MDGMNQQRLRYLKAVRDEGSLLHAAKRLGITRQAVGRQLSVLEREAGVALFLRGVKPMELTAAGRALADEAPPAAPDEAAGRRRHTTSRSQPA